MARRLAFVIGTVAVLAIVAPRSVAMAQAQFGTQKQARAMLERAVAAMKKDKEKALALFNKGDGGFRDRDLYVFCANASDGILTAHPYLKGDNLTDIVGRRAVPSARRS